MLGRGKSHDFSNYILRIDPETCEACGLCAKRCPVRALKITDSPLAKNKRGKAAKFADSGRCLGCGVCVYKCPTQSLSLELRMEIQDPPQDAREWMARLLMDQERAKSAGGPKRKK